MKALLLAAGYGTRLKPLTETIPKCMVDIKGKPLLNYWLNILNNEHINEIIINTHYLPEIVNDFISSYKSKKKITIIHEPSLLGTAGTIRSIKKIIEFESELFVAHADNYSSFNFPSFLKTFTKRSNHIDFTMMTFKTFTPELCGIVNLNSSQEVIGFHEKPKNFIGNIANGAVYIFSKSVLNRIIEDDNISDISNDLIPLYIKKINTFYNDNIHIDIGNLDSLKYARNI
jgi:mannose-1-phosphate guanylyltransferase